MGKWLRMAIAGLALLWAPFLYKEWTRGEPATEADSVRQADADLEDDDEELEEEPVQVAPMPAHPPVQDEPTTPAGEEQPAEVAHAPNGPQAAPPQRDAPSAQPADAPESADDTPEASAEDGDEDRAQAGLLAAMPASGPVALLKGVFEGETRDSLWATDREAFLTGLMTDTGFPAEAIDEVSCMRTVCRLGLAVGTEDLAAMSNAFKELQNKHGSSVAVQPGVTTDDATPIIVYVPREGYSLSDLAKK
ncbi:MAG: hypothetical protein OXU20_00265 [Myxococcales bacterium]|nr:hypothetical protein [Myxococcales bacterium]MDD9969848.1 hypothetical protein [Myxococcales bacterium]